MRGCATAASWLRPAIVPPAPSQFAFHRARRAEGFTAWPAPNILNWKSFAQAQWEKRTLDGRLVLNPLQEQSLWAAIAGAERQMATLLEGPRHRLAVLAMEAHELLCAYAPRLLRENARGAWQQDAAAFSGWLTAFDEACRAGNLLSPARLALELIPLLGNVPDGSSQSEAPAQRPPLLLAGFDRILPIQRAFFDAWGTWRQATLDEPASHIHFHEAADAQAELTACALWCQRQLAANPSARLLVVTQDATRRRGEIERAFLKHTGPSASPLFEFSLGVPLSQVALPRERSPAAALALRPAGRARTRLVALHRPRRRQPAGKFRAASAHARAAPPLSATASLDPGRLYRPAAGQQLPAAWVARMSEAQRRLAEFARRPQSPLDWAELVPQLLDAAGFAQARPLSSAEFQAVRRWQQALDACGSLGFDGRRIPWSEFLSVLARTLDETLFAPESRDAPIQIAGPAESAGLTADAVWFLGADEDAWPPRRLNPSAAAARGAARSPHAPRHSPARLGSGPRHHHPPACLRAGGPLQLCKAKRRSRSPPLALDRAVCRAASAVAAGVDRAAQPAAANSNLSRTSAKFPSRTTRSKAAPASSPRSRNAPSRPLPPRAWPRRIGALPRPA